MGCIFSWLGAFKDEASIAMREPDPAEKARRDASILAEKQKQKNINNIAKRNERERKEREERERQAAQQLEEEQAAKNAEMVRTAPQRQAEHNAYMAATQEKLAKLKANKAERAQQGGKRRSSRKSTRRSKKRRGTKRQVR